MSIDSLTYALLNTNCSISRVYPIRLPKNATYPCAVYEPTFFAPMYALDGATGVNDASVDVEIMAETVAGLNSVESDIVTNLSGFTGTVGSIEVYSTRIEDVSTTFSEEGDVFVRTITIGILYKE